MEFRGFIGGSYTLKSTNADVQRTVNLYPEINESGAGKSIASLIYTPGLELVSTMGSGPSRANYTASKGRSFAVSGNTLYEISTPESPVSRGTLYTTQGSVSMSDNGVHLIIVDGVKGYVFKFSDNSFRLITDTDFPVAQYVAFVDQYLIVNDANTGNFFLSGLSNAPDWDGLDFAAAESSPDNLKTLLVDHGELFLFGDESTEIWVDTGNSDFPFERLANGRMEFGIKAPNSAQKLDSGVFLLAQDKNGGGMVYRIQGYQGVRVSTYAVENALKASSDLSLTTSWTYQDAGHTFYCLNAPGLKSTWVLDVSTNQWHERQSNFGRHWAENHCVVNGRHIVGDYRNGNLYELKDSVDTDNGTPKIWMRRSPHLSKELKQVRHNELVIDANVGESAKTVMLRHSDNGGKTWSNERWVSWQVGEYGKRARWQRLGSARDRVYEASGEGNVILTATYIDAQAGQH